MRKGRGKDTQKAVCGAKKRDGNPCGESPMPNGRCRMHGGMSVKGGAGHHTFKHGKYSKYLVSMEAIDERLEDPNLLDARRPIAAQEYVLARCLQAAEDAIGDEIVERLEAVAGAAEAMSKAQKRYWDTALSGRNAIAYSEFVGLMIRFGHILEEVCGAESARIAMARADKELCNGALKLAG